MSAKTKYHFIAAQPVIDGEINEIEDKTGSFETYKEGANVHYNFVKWMGSDFLKLHIGSNAPRAWDKHHYMGPEDIDQLIEFLKFAKKRLEA